VSSEEGTSYIVAECLTPVNGSHLQTAVATPLTTNRSSSVLHGYMTSAKAHQPPPPYSYKNENKIISSSSSHQNKASVVQSTDNINILNSLPSVSYSNSSRIVSTNRIVSNPSVDLRYTSHSSGGSIITSVNNVLDNHKLPPTCSIITGTSTHSNVTAESPSIVYTNELNSAPIVDNVMPSNNNLSSSSIVLNNKSSIVSQSNNHVGPTTIMINQSSYNQKLISNNNP